MVLPGGELAGLFWFGFIVLGLLVPVAVELYYVLPRLLYERAYASPPAADVFTCALVLLGGFMLRYVVLLAGQITGPIGI
ncbi:MAG: NrfD/PsrC family molybdoenzyme membrane anchor subunit [Gammaproteobacteria bacterium]|nr:NrfD/PsrC family molybdoenzyme membrane anchor subunit [Gammaproteobacteria bacterium]